jgi:hypothetical protein
MKRATFLSSAVLLAVTCSSFFAANGQTNVNIGSGMQVVSDGMQVSMTGGNFINDGRYTDTTGTFNMLGGILVSGSGNTTLNNLNINNTGSSRFNSLVSVNNITNLISGDLDANNNLFIRSDRFAGANMAVSGVLSGNVLGLATRPSVSAGPCPAFSSTLSLNISGPVVVYQWQSSPDSITWSDVAGATTYVYTPVVTADAYYRCRLSTTNSAYTENTPGVKLTLTGIPAAATVSGSGIHCANATLLAAGGSGGVIYFQDTVSGGVSTLSPSVSEYIASSGTYYFRSRSAAGCWGPEGNAAVTIISRVTPSVSMVANPGTRICEGSNTTFTALPLNGGTAPFYRWYVNGFPAGTNDSTFSYVPYNGDRVEVDVTTSNWCVTDTNASIQATMTVDPNIPPVVSIAASPGTNIANGQSDTLQAIVENGGPAAAYQWLKNGAIIPGATSAIYISSSFHNRDSIACVVTRGGICALASSNSIVITVITAGVRNLIAGSNIGIIPNPSKGDFMVKGTMAGGISELMMEVTNMLGQVVYKRNIEVNNGRIDEHVNIGNMQNGTYILSLITGGERAAFHIVVER